LGGPPPRPMPKIKLEIDSNGDIYANGYESGLPLYGEE
jgi:Rieske Fe-S protein